MALITYDDKQAMGTQPTIPDVNKVTDSDMNEIKAGINGSTTYSTSEIKCGTWIDGKPIYRKVVTGSFTSYEALTINLNINNLRRIYSISGVITNIPESGGEGNVFIFPSYRGPSGTTGIQVFGANTSNGAIVTISPESDRTGYDVYAIVEYTKTTD